MRKILISAVTATLLLAGCSGESGINCSDIYAHFEYFNYSGNDSFFDSTLISQGKMFNPILSGSYCDASICRKGNDYYAVFATYSFYPGLSVLHSTDLVNWKQVGFALEGDACLNTSLNSEQGLFASTIRYNPNDNRFYITGTFVGGGGHFVISAEDPAGEWTKPVWLYGLGGVHSSLFFDDNGAAYILNQGNPDYESPYSGYKVIWCQEFDTKQMKNTGFRKIILEGGDLPEKKPIWAEAPHIYKINGKYMLSTSEGGGLGNGAAGCVYYADSVWGPYKRCPHNPVITQRILPIERPYSVTNTGHLDFFNTPDNRWFVLFSGVRPYNGKNDYLTGRETFMLPVTFDNEGWPVVLKRGETVPNVIDMPLKNTSYSKDPEYIPVGNFSFCETFTGDSLPYSWNYLRSASSETILQDPGQPGINISLGKNAIRQRLHSNFISTRLRHNFFSFDTKMDFMPLYENQFAGSALYAGDAYNIEFGVSQRNKKISLILQKAVTVNDSIGKEEIKRIDIDKDYHGRIYLKTENRKDGLAFYYKFKKDDQWLNFIDCISPDYLSANNKGTFIGTYIGLYASKNE